MKVFVTDIFPFCFSYLLALVSLRQLACWIQHGYKLLAVQDNVRLEDWACKASVGLRCWWCICPPCSTRLKWHSVSHALLRAMELHGGLVACMLCSGRHLPVILLSRHCLAWPMWLKILGDWMMNSPNGAGFGQESRICRRDLLCFVLLI